MKRQDIRKADEIDRKINELSESASIIKDEENEVLAKHGERKDGHYNFWFRLLSTTITFMILYSGGFFS